MTEKKPKRGRWTQKEDFFLAAYFEDIGDYIGPHDLGRAPGAAARRVAQLKKAGEWEALKKLERATR